MEEEICVLDTGPTSGGEGDSKRTVGRSERDPSPGRVGEDATGTGAVAFAAPYFVDTKRINQCDYAPCYERGTQDVLGEQDLHNNPNPPSNEIDPRRCFNCGSPSHTLSDCPSPRNHALITLSRQLFTFYQQLHQSAHRQALGDFERIHIVEGRKNERLDWLDGFEPGEVRGQLLREALGLDGDKDGCGDGDGQWLGNMAVWGYPKGWTGERDPRYEVMRRIEGEVNNTSDGEDDVFWIFGDSDETEEITFATALSESETNSKADPEEEGGGPAPLPKIHRWASYPTTHFSSALLPIYTGYALPPLHTDSPTFMSDRQALWDHITSGNPPPPSASPPPLPPPDEPLVPEELDGEVEMDFSDSD